MPETPVDVTIPADPPDDRRCLRAHHAERDCRQAIELLKKARVLLRKAGARAAYERAAATIKSAEGAQRGAEARRRTAMKKCRRCSGVTA